MTGNPKHQTHHVAVLAFPFTSHPGSLLDLVLKLAPAAPHVLFSFFTTSKANTSLFSKPSSSFHNMKAHDIADGLPEGFVPSVNPEEAIGLFLKVAPGNFMRALKDAEAATGLKVRCLLTDAFFWFAGDMAEEIKVPWVPVWIGGPHSILVHVETDFIRQRVGTISSTGGEKQALDFLPGFSRYQIPDLPEGVVTGDLDSPVATMLQKMGQKLPKAAAVVMNSFDDLAPEIDNVLKSRFKGLLNYGPKSLISQSPQLPKDDSGCLEWLDTNKPASVIYIAFGTAVTPPPHELEALAQALIETRFPFIWSFRGNIEDFLPKGYNKSSLNGKIVSYASQVQVLGHASVGVFLTHAGWHSVLESIAAGVPMICRPIFADNMLNMRTVVAVWGIGTKFEGGVITKIGMVKALELVLKHKEGKEMRDKIVALKNLAQQAVESNGSSTHAFNSLVDIVTK
ncbi:flavonoid 3-O-glucosyltransferase [Prunus yedoensis var. nudiflora]|uniref:Flavonoid 3-O-glucosyltransferase n=1 Tax=Prunus yedoensis var. nudiflora TaxID=2094558 RepID=A0A314UXX9_PRUYE|nr:flavonoid 3-O-glucosyltransferase [Prunus yedoensis var. nudiflora]